MHEVRHIRIAIDRPCADVYAFASNPANLPLWAAGLTNAELRRDGDVWLAQAPFGRVRIRFAEHNAFGVLDHDVELESGLVVHNPMRVVPNGEGCEFTFTLLRQAGMSDEDFRRDRLAVEADLASLKALLETHTPPTRQRDTN